MKYQYSILFSPQEGTRLWITVNTYDSPLRSFSRRLDMTNTVVRQVVESTRHSISLCLVKDLYLVQKDAEIKRVKTVDEDLDVKEKVRFVCQYSGSWLSYNLHVSMEPSFIVDNLWTVLNFETTRVRRIDSYSVNVDMNISYCLVLDSKKIWAQVLKNLDYTVRLMQYVVDCWYDV